MFNITQLNLVLTDKIVMSDIFSLTQIQSE